LQVEGATDKSKLDEFRATNVDLLKQQEAYKGVDLEKFRKYEDQERKLVEGDLIAKKDFEGLVLSRTQSLTADFEAKIENLTSQLTDNTGSYNTLVSKYEIEGAATKAFGEHKINPEAYDSVMAQIKSKFSIDNGKVIAREGDNILAGADGNLTVSEFVASQPEIFKIQSNGGHGNGSEESSSSMKQGTSSQDKIKSGLAARMA
jgi:uncharacterized Zn-binding protein involved in type VI secretion